MSYEEFTQDAEQHKLVFKRFGNGYVYTEIYADETNGKLTLWVQEGSLFFKKVFANDLYTEVGRMVMTERETFNKCDNPFLALAYSKQFETIEI